MRNALGAVESLLVLGGTSDIGVAVVERLARDRLRRVVLAVRDPEAPAARDAAARAGAAGVEQVVLLRFDAADTAAHAAVLSQATEAIGDIDALLVAFGVLGDQDHYDDHPGDAVRDAAVNYLGAVSVAMEGAALLRRQGHGTIILLSSVAAERARKTNFVYGSAKAGADALAQGLGDRLIGTGARVLVVRPGFVHSRMTEGMPAQPFATTPDVVADAVADGLRTGRHTVWAPGILRYVFAVLRHLPRPLWRIVSAR
jgi:decaprenylphospho-beta-D-erythro-pentofuranosid-2-ulose 2-reductase